MRTTRALAVTLALALVLSACAGTGRRVTDSAWPPPSGRGPCGVSKQTDVPARMRDGTVLRADLYRPDTSDPVPDPHAYPVRQVRRPGPAIALPES